MFLPSIMKNSTYFSKSDPKKVEEPTATGVLHLTNIFVKNNSEDILLAFIKLSTNFLAKRTDVRDSFFTVATWGRLQYVFRSVEQKTIAMHLPNDPPNPKESILFSGERPLLVMLVTENIRYACSIHFAECSSDIQKRDY